ncbi:hypothetical protein PFISCL1PPCAC_4427, partial [Pristionchus fissidentatus]
HLVDTGALQFTLITRVNESLTSPHRRVIVQVSNIVGNIAHRTKFAVRTPRIFLFAKFARRIIAHFRE